LFLLSDYCYVLFSLAARNRNSSCTCRQHHTDYFTIYINIMQTHSNISKSFYLPQQSARLVCLPPTATSPSSLANNSLILALSLLSCFLTPFMMSFHLPDLVQRFFGGTNLSSGVLLQYPINNSLHRSFTFFNIHLHLLQLLVHQHHPMIHQTFDSIALHQLQ
jgi:hypothetical protein